MAAIQMITEIERLIITGTMKEMVEATPGATPEMVMDLLKDVQGQMQQIKKHFEIYGFEQTMHDLYADMDEHTADVRAKMSEPVSCRMGCAHCCHINLDITEWEADIMVDYAEKHNIPVDMDILKEQKGASVETRSRLEHSGCVFLDAENKCRVYEVRPAGCRNYSVVTDPDLCDNKKKPKTPIGRVPVFQAEMLASALANMSSGGDIATMLLKSIEKRKLENHAESQ